MNERYRADRDDAARAEVLVLALPPHHIGSLDSNALKFSSEWRNTR
jgi:hypothetical protein